jgi:hypothetical protein
MEDKRKADRKQATGGVLYTIAEPDPGRSRTGLLSNISESGACIYTQECITDATIRIYFNGISRKPVNADVMWCNTAVDDLFKVGLRFEN